MRAFGDGLREGRDRVLWRLDSHPEQGLILLVQSRSKPDWSLISEDGAQKYLAITTAAPFAEIRLLRLSLDADQTFNFRLRANPTIKRRFRKFR